MTQDKLKIIPLGGVGDVTKNLYVYQYGGDILLVDCGIGFPTESMLGVDLVIPDVSYLDDKVGQIRGLVLTHGHEDHIGALPYLLPRLKNPPVHGTKLTLGLAEVKMREMKVKGNFNTVSVNDKLKIGAFEVNFVHMTHSVPDATNLIIKTPIGIIYHASDFKFDWMPVDGWQSEVGKIAGAGDQGVLCLLSDCLGSERQGYTRPEREIEENYEGEIQKTPGKFLVTTQSSNISRLKQAMNVALKYGRKIVLVGRSIDQNMEVAQKLNVVNFPPDLIVDLSEIGRYKDSELCFLVAGSQGQEGSALSRIANRDHQIKLKEGDTVVFSSDPIPGNESEVGSLIDALIKEGARVVYRDISNEFHVSGHGSSGDLMLMIGLTRPKYLLPIGGTYKQMKQYQVLARNMGYADKQILLIDDGQVVEFDADGGLKVESKIEVKNILVDGLGIGDVGKIVLRDRQHMAEDGVVVVIVPVDGTSKSLAGEIDIVSRGFVYVRESEELLKSAKSLVKDFLLERQGRISDWNYFRRRIENLLEKLFFDETKRRPMILTVLVKV